MQTRPADRELSQPKSLRKERQGTQQGTIVSWTDMDSLSKNQLLGEVQSGLSVLAAELYVPWESEAVSRIKDGVSAIPKRFFKAT